MPEYLSLSFCFFFNDTATTEIYTLSLHDALPISREVLRLARRLGPRRRAVCRLLERRGRVGGDAGEAPHGDRKSTRLNSSHANISYAVFCLKKKPDYSLHRRPDHHLRLHLARSWA